MITPDRLIVSSTNDHFLDFLPTVSRVWTKMFPNIKICLALVDDGLPEILKKRLSMFAEVCIFPHFYDIPRPNLAKVIRFIYASMCENEVCIIEDIDTVPLERNHILNFLSQYEADKILMVGKEVYDDPAYDPIEQGKCPISYMTGTGNSFKALFNPQNLEYKKLLESYCALPKFKGEKEMLFNPPEFFSDESLIRSLIHHNKAESRVKKINRNIDTKTQCIDRANFIEKDIDINKLKNGEYLFWNFCRPLIGRPFEAHIGKVLFLMEHIHGRKTTLNEILL